jgi:hypothetical protein
MPIFVANFASIKGLIQLLSSLKLSTYFVMVIDKLFCEYIPDSLRIFIPLVHSLVVALLSNCQIFAVFNLTMAVVYFRFFQSY